MVQTKGRDNPQVNEPISPSVPNKNPSDDPRRNAPEEPPAHQSEEPSEDNK